MSNDPNQSQSPFKLNSSRVILLILGALLVVYLISSLMGGLSNYQQLKEAADAAKTEQPAKP